MKKILSIVLAAVMLMGIGTAVFAEETISTQNQEIKELRDELKLLVEQLQVQRVEMKEKVTVISERQGEARQNKEWDILKTIREYRRTHISYKKGKMDVLLEKLDAMDLMDEARKNKDPELAVEALTWLIEIAQDAIDLNISIIENMDDCIASIS